MHALDGHTTALFVVQELMHATEELAVQLEGYKGTTSSATGNSEAGETVSEPIDLLNTLLEEEHKDFEKFQKADLPELAYHLHEWHKCNKKFSKEEEDLERECSPDADFDPLVSTFYKGPGICHTARLPSETRYKGYLVNDVTRVGGPAPAGEETYATGYPINGDMKVDGTLKLVLKPEQRDAGCPVTVSPDYKDFFYAHEKDGWAKLILPNDAEKAAYEYKASEFKGLIGVAFLTCPWNRCPKGFVGTKRDFDQKKFEVTVNGVAATSLMLFQDLGCYFLKGPDGFQWKNRDGTEDYEIAIRVLEKGGHVEVSSFILY